MARALTRQRTKAEAPRSAETSLARAHASARERQSLSCATSRLELITEVVTSWIVEASCWISAEKSAMLCLVCFASVAASASFSATLRSCTNTQHAKGTQASQKGRSASPQPQQSRRLRSCFVGGGSHLQYRVEPSASTGPIQGRARCSSCSRGPVASVYTWGNKMPR